MTPSAYEEFYADFKKSTSSEARKAAGKGILLDYEELAGAYKEAAVLATKDEFRQMAGDLAAGMLWGYSLKPQETMHTLTRNALLDGALRSFQQGSPEKLHLALTEFSSTFGAPATILFRAIAESNDPGAAVRGALQAGMSGPDRQAFLDSSLAYAVGQNEPRAIEALLNAGADANHKSPSGFPGYLLMVAARKGAAVSTVKLLHDNGASFEDAIFLLRAQDGAKSEIEKLQFYQEKVTGKPAPETDVSGKMQALLAEMLEMKQEITTLKKEVARLSRSPGKKGSRSAKRSP